MPGADCFERGLKLLAIRPHFRAELERKLRQRGYEDSEVEAALDRLASLGHLNDAATAGAFAESRQRRQLEGPRRLRAELARRGVGAAVIQEAVENQQAGSDERGAAKTVAEKWLARRPVNAEKDRAALARHLDRRGFTPAVIAETLRACAPR